MGISKTRDSDISQKNKRGKVLQQNMTKSVIDEVLHDDEKPFPTPLKGKPVALRNMNQIDMHTISASGSANNLNKVLEEKSPKGQSNRGSSKNVHGFFNDTINQKRDSFPPYDAMGSEKNNSARPSEVDKKWIDKNNKVSPLNLDDSKSDNGY